MTRYILFDFDGTIANSEKAILYSWNVVAKMYGYKEVKPDDIQALKKLSIREVSHKLRFKMHMIPFLMPRFYRLYKEAIRDVTIFDGIKDVFLRLEERGYKVAILSSNSRDNILSFLRKHDIHHITNVYTSSSLFGKDKLIRKFLRTHRLTTADVMYIGDELRDIVACRKVGVTMTWVSWGLNSFEAVKEADPDYRAFKPEDILKIV